MNNHTKFYTEKTLESWDEAADIHAAKNTDLEQRVSVPGFNALEEDFNLMVDRFDLSEKSVVQVCCNNGKDLISLKNKGAGYCLGLDGSQKFITQAKQLAQASRQPDIEFACVNLYDIPSEPFPEFDFLASTVGVIGWMPDLQVYFKICASLIKPGGYFLMEEIHPVLNMYIEGPPSTLGMSYFDRSPQRDTEGLDYFEGEKYKAKENYYFQHTFSDILTAAISSGLELQYIEETAANVGNYCADLEREQYNPPLAFVACWRKTPENKGNHA
ncbi:class I SAM-dependent methyltransferase [Microbulbifer celer]|uniref:Class I SAM-dependent methyltransferase n=1 Tax=Microbulbifer celer TaxID=435905 RepID=A0ABW3U8R3_9GAMM|nr:class I SAM-dependent methyltransferase [Microbulbifer celer]UFN56724.1 class I SAM-dependent methyltransferase [Microbulbifer celer]